MAGRGASAGASAGLAELWHKHSVSTALLEAKRASLAASVAGKGIAEQGSTEQGPAEHGSVATVVPATARRKGLAAVRFEAITIETWRMSA